MNQDSELNIETRVKSKTLKAQIRSQLIKGLFKEDPEDLKSPITPSEDQTSSLFQDEENKEKNESKRNTKSKCFEEIYEMNEKIIGQGMHAVVKKARNKNTGQIVAVKVLRSGDPEIIRSVMREFQNVSILDHPSIIKPYDLYINKITERIHYVMEYAKYKSLNHYLVKIGAFQETNTINIIRKLLVTLNYMHNKGICHRDITPKNVLVSSDYKTIKLIDFGVSKQFAHYFFKQGAHFKKSMKMFTYTGVCQYLAPEILRGEGYNFSVDIWSVGILTYQLMSGKLPFNSDYVSEILELIMSGDLNFPSNFSHLSKDFIKRILNPDCKKRLTAKEALSHPWLFLQEKEEVNSIGVNFKKYSQKKPSILTISALRNRIPSIDDIEIDTRKHTFSRFKEKFKEKMSIQGLDLHVHTIENKEPFRLVSPKLRALGKSSVLASVNLVLENRKVKTGKSFENNEEEKT